MSDGRASLTAANVLDARLVERLTATEAQQVRRHLELHAEPASERRFFADADALRDAAQVFQKAVDRSVSLWSVAAAIDHGAGKRTLANELLRVGGVDESASSSAGLAGRQPSEEQQKGAVDSGTLAHTFFQDFAKQRLVLQRMQAGERFDSFLHHLGYSSDDIAVYRGQAVGDGVRNAFDKWLAAGHTLREFCAILDAMGEAVLKSKLGLQGMATSSAEHAAVAESADVRGETSSAKRDVEERARSVVQSADDVAHDDGGEQECTCVGAPGTVSSHLGDRVKSIAVFRSASNALQGEGVLLSAEGDRALVLTALHVVNANDPLDDEATLAKDLFVTFPRAAIGRRAVFKVGAIERLAPAGDGGDMRPDWAIVALRGTNKHFKALGSLPSWALSDDDCALFECCGAGCRQLTVVTSDGLEEPLLLGANGTASHQIDNHAALRLHRGHSGAPVVNKHGDLVGLYRGETGVWLFGRSGAGHANEAQVRQDDRALSALYPDGHEVDK